MSKTQRVAYKHQWQGGEEIPLPVGKVVCVGRNYAEHAKELNNPIPTEPLLFMKPATSLVDFSQPVKVPQGFGEVHYETEIAILIGEPIIAQDGELPSLADCEKAILGVAGALDLTLRDLQSQLKEKGQPWEKAKAFDGSCPIGGFVKPSELSDLSDLDVSLDIDGNRVQSGNSSDMLTPILQLLRYTSQFFSLMPGDVVLTGTPKGVGQILPGQTLSLSLDQTFTFQSVTV
ncbi:fumarylacetoacetate hydrolase family protein [Litoribrevibacter albus]|uniref:Fumarylacetoacetase-like C-terminal domain-containing protein n=1 Tax=Litoribrevibacter albus TaxID=1473156 RepID=A0AA37S7M0_9GAMM|nr:fumarylacetoacetate hydrolase family protein [Litoribrevibacter albus]GLQ30607.1 hypothetical protein GCM10007876_10850 [Litoribrevibacter albus]